MFRIASLGFSICSLQFLMSCRQPLPDLLPWEGRENVWNILQIARIVWMYCSQIKRRSYVNLSHTCQRLWVFIWDQSLHHKQFYHILPLLIAIWWTLVEFITIHSHKVTSRLSLTSHPHDKVEETFLPLCRRQRVLHLQLWGQFLS